ncbi:cytochrome c-type biogenesis protein CcmE homolog, mitochondrial [Primulina huaijiensis]|uniref:cytochrome c-type biogenesis protein CcmE homolog, mitochondrial n=1 Tax=Primulina huaijiensis TaxID=1492673 RepID=UPI003CC75941
MAGRCASHLLRRHLGRHFATAAASTVLIPKSHPLIPYLFNSHLSPFVNHPKRLDFSLRFLSTGSIRPTRRNKPDIGARARQLQTRRLWTYAITFSCIAGFIIIVINQFQDQLVFYVTPTDALQKYEANPSKSKFRLGGLVLENSVAEVPTSPEIQFVVTDLITDILVRYEGRLPDLFREGHSVVVEGFIRPVDEEARKKEDAIMENSSKLVILEKARNLACYFKATEVLAKHDEKYMPAEVAVALEKNKKKLKEEEEQKKRDEALISANGGDDKNA